MDDLRQCSPNFTNLERGRLVWEYRRCPSKCTQNCQNSLQHLTKNHDNRYEFHVKLSYSRVGGKWTVALCSVEELDKNQTRTLAHILKGNVHAKSWAETKYNAWLFPRGWLGVEQCLCPRDIGWIEPSTDLILHNALSIWDWLINMGTHSHNHHFSKIMAAAIMAEWP